jgi:WD40 repeat protein
VLGVGGAAVVGTLAGCHPARKDPLAGRPDVVTLTGAVWTVADLAFSPDGRLLAVSGGDGHIWLWEVATRRPAGSPRAAYRTTNQPSPAADGVAFSPDGRLLAFSDERDGAVRLWDIAAGRLVDPPLDSRPTEVTGLEFSADGALLVVSGSSRVRLWDVAGRRLVAELGPEYSHAVFSPDGTRLAILVLDPRDHRTVTVRFWDVATRRTVGAPITGASFTFHSVRFSPDGRLLASHDYESVRFWDLGTHQPFGSPLAERPHLFHTMAFRPDGKVLATTTTNGDRGAVWLWDTSSGRRVGPVLDGLSQFVYGLAFDPTGALLAVSDDTDIRLWAVPGR